MASLQPFCVASNNNGVIYAVSFAYDLARITTSSYPDQLVLIKGSTPTGLRQDINWTSVSSAPRSTVGIFPEPPTPYTYVCGISRDSSMFMLRVGGSGQSFSVQIPTAKYVQITAVQDVSQGSQDPGITNEVASWMRGPSFLMPTIDFNSSQPVTTPGDEILDWMHLDTLQRKSDLLVSRSNNSFPWTPQKSFPGAFKAMPSGDADPLGIAYANNELYLLSQLDQNTSAVRSILFEYNATNPNWFNTNSAGVDLATLGGCTYQYSCMAALESLVYVVCSQSTSNPEQAMFSTIDPKASTTASFPIKIPASYFDYRTYYGSAPKLIPITNKTFMMTDGVKVFWIDTTGGIPVIDLYTVPPMKQFTFDNPNPDMTSKPLTFSGTDTFAIVVGCLVLAALLVWAQRLFFKWRASKWVDDGDIPGSKVAEEVPDHSQNQGLGDLQSSASLYVPPVYSENVARNNSHSSMAPLTATNGGSPGLRSDELELVTFSSHPRPNVVTTITDGSSENTHSPREHSPRE